MGLVHFQFNAGFGYTDRLVLKEVIDNTVEVVDAAGQCQLVDAQIKQSVR